MSFTPLPDRVLVRRIEGDETTRGGLIIPDTAKEKPQEGEVVTVGAVGEGARTANASRWTSGPATGSCLKNGPAQKSNSMAKTF